MWKFVTRGIRESIERRACRTNVYSQPSTDNAGAKSEVKTNFVQNQKFLAPNVASSSDGFCGSSKSGGAKDKKYESHWGTRRSWPEVVGWSSVLAIGWVVGQTLCLRKRLLQRYKEEKWQNRLMRYHGIPLSLIENFDLGPRHVLPVTNCVGNCIIKTGEDSPTQEWTSPRPYGPITIEEALKEAKDDYTRTHRLVMGEFELRFGVRALQEKRYKDAVKHFATGANLSSTGSMFNLGLCHELGIGTVTDVAKAAKFYRNAAERGHPDAMYNLGVFHAQGRGGLCIDIKKARELFTEAANLGQIQARVALDLEKNSQVLQPENWTIDETSPSFVSSDDEDGDRMLSSDRYDNCPAEKQRDNEASSKILYFEDHLESVQNSTDIFLNALGIRTNSMPILVGSHDSNVPYT